MQDIIKKIISEHIEGINEVYHNDKLIQAINEVCDILIRTYKQGGKVLLCGNGGSASDALHFAGELVGKFKMERRALSAIVLNADLSALTAIANDYGYDAVFSRQVEAHMKKNDVLICFSTSGNSKNIIEAVKVAKKNEGITIAFTGASGGQVKELVDYLIAIPSGTTARIQEIHILCVHILCELIEKALNEGRTENE